MKSFAIAALLGMVEASPIEDSKVWQLRSLNWHKGDTTEFRTFGDKFRDQSDKTYPFYVAKKIPAKKSVGDGSGSEENPLPEKEAPEAEAELQLNAGYEYGWYQPWESCEEDCDEAPYIRKIPGHYDPGNDGDIFVHSMLKKYAVEEKKCNDDMEACVPPGHFYLIPTGARFAAKEVLATHMGLTGEA